MPTRYPARLKDLPPAEIKFLNQIASNEFLRAIRCRELFEAGWTLRAIADAFRPLPKARSTIYTWIQTVPAGTRPPSTTVFPPPPAYAAAILTAADEEIIQELAPVARKYRGQMKDHHPAAIANRELTDICKRHYRNGVSVSMLARALGVSIKAVNKRLGRA